MIFGRKKKGGPPVFVKYNIQGLLGGQYLSVNVDLELPAGSTVQDGLEVLKKSGQIDPATYKVIKGVKLPLNLLINGESISGRGRAKTPLSDGDNVSVFTPVMGG